MKYSWSDEFQQWVPAAALPEWDGTELPPVGTECDVRVHYKKPIYEPCKIVYSGDGGISFVYKKSGAVDCIAKQFAKSYFRPTQS